MGERQNGRDPKVCHFLPCTSGGFEFGVSIFCGLSLLLAESQMDNPAFWEQTRCLDVSIFSGRFSCRLLAMPQPKTGKASHPPCVFSIGLSCVFF